MRDDASYAALAAAMERGGEWVVGELEAAELAQQEPLTAERQPVNEVGEAPSPI